MEGSCACYFPNRELCLRADLLRAFVAAAPQLTEFRLDADLFGLAEATKLLTEASFRTLRAQNLSICHDESGAVDNATVVALCSTLSSQQAVAVLRLYGVPLDRPGALDVLSSSRMFSMLRGVHLVGCHLSPALVPALAHGDSQRRSRMSVDQQW